jgi:hypothetical protein
MQTLFDDDDSLLIDIQEPSETREVQSLGLMAVLPADFPLPSLIRFVPDPALKAQIDAAAEAALGIEVVGASGLRQADQAIASLRRAVGDVRQHFEEPASQAHALHVAITSCRGQWMQAGETAITVVGRRIAAETARLQAIADADRRKAQAEADAREREARRRHAEEAARQAAPEHIVQAMKAEAETATAPPVAPAASSPPPLASTTILQTWKARPAGTPADAEPNPEIGDLSPMQAGEIRKLMRAAADGLESLACFSIDWGYINRRAKAEGKAFRMVGVEAFQDSSTRAKPGRRVSR